MSILVTPSPLVDISTSEAGIDDFLRLVLEDGEHLFVRKHTGNEFSPYTIDLEEAQFTFDMSMPPRGLRRLSIRAARLFLAELSDDERLRFEAIYAGRSNRELSPLSFVARELRREPSVKAARTHLSVLPDPFNVGTCVEARLSPQVKNLCIEQDTSIWRSQAPITRIEPVDRCDALIEYYALRQRV